MRKRDDNTMPSVNDDLLDDLVDDDNEVLISVDFRDFEIEREWILIYEICSEDFSVEALDDEVKFVNEKISKKLSKSALKTHIFDVKRKSAIRE
jgi:hypothetical protein